MIGVGPAAAYQAIALMRSKIPFPLLVDPQRHLATAMGLERQSLHRYVFNLRAWLRWITAFARHRRQYRITGHYSDVPAVAVVGANGDVAYLYRGRSIGDYPALDDALDALATLTSNPPA